MAILYIIATPIGNLADMTPRGIEILKSLDILFCEDTRHTGNLLSLLGIPRPRTMLSNHEFNERGNAARVVGFLNDGQNVGICSDAGYPVISDPGYPAVVAAIAAGHEIQVIPGASAVLMAVVASGLPCSSFTFKGFPPRKSGARRRFLEQDAASIHTMVFYESPFRVGKFLEEALAVLGDRRAAVCMELTKQFERVNRGTLSELVAQFGGKKIKGEAVVVIEGCRDGRAAPVDDEREAEDDSPEEEGAV